MSPRAIGSTGVYEPYDHEAPAPRRSTSPQILCSATRTGRYEAYTLAAKKVCADYGVALPEIKVSTCGGSPWLGGYHPVPHAENTDLGTLIHRELQKENHA